MSIIQRVLIVFGLAGLLVCVLGMVGCPQPPVPTPVPGPTPVYDAAPIPVLDAASIADAEVDVLPTLLDAFILATADCGTVGVKNSLSTSRPPVETCLILPALDVARQCLLRMMPTWSLDSIVCSVRSVGMSAFKAQSAGIATPTLLLEASMSRMFIVAEKFSIRN
jgi:hypothetical protein